MDSNLASQKKKIAVVVQRCGVNIAAGAEVYALKLAEALADSGSEVHIFTSQSDSYINWNNNLLPSEEVLTAGGEAVLIRRFPVIHGRLSFLFAVVKRLCFLLNRAPFCRFKPLWSVLDYLFLRTQGPWCPSLWRTLSQESSEYSLCIVKSYLYAPNVYALKVCQNKVKSLFIVTAHNEKEFKLPFARKNLERSFSLGFVSFAEKKLCNEIWQEISQKKSLILPPGLENSSQNTFKKISLKVAELSKTKFFLYLGRIDKNKNIEFIFKNTPKDCRILLAGEKNYPIPANSSFVYIGQINDGEKALLFQKALALLMVSRLEAFSIVTAEALSQNCFVLALQGCAPVDELINAYGGLSCPELEFWTKMTELWEGSFKPRLSEIKSEELKRDKTWKANAQKICKELL